MARRPRRSVSRPDYVALSDVKLPSSKKRSDTQTFEGNNDELYRLQCVENSTCQGQGYSIVILMNGEQEMILLN